MDDNKFTQQKWSIKSSKNQDELTMQPHEMLSLVTDEVGIFVDLNLVCAEYS